MQPVIIIIFWFLLLWSWILRSLQSKCSLFRDELRTLVWRTGSLKRNCTCYQTWIISLWIWTSVWGHSQPSANLCLTMKELCGVFTPGGGIVLAKWKPAVIYPRSTQNLIWQRKSFKTHSSDGVAVLVRQTQIWITQEMFRQPWSSRGWNTVTLVILWLCLYCHHEEDGCGFEWNVSINWWQIKPSC